MSFRRDQRGDNEAFLLRRAADWPEFTTLENLDARALRTIKGQHGVDFATAVLFDRFNKSARHAAFIRRVDSSRHGVAPALHGLDLKVVVVPGALYLERPDLGGDGRTVRGMAAQAGASTDLIPLASRGSVTTNARIIRDWIARHAGERLVLVSLSKGGADLKMALTAPGAGDLFRDVVGWVNVCGPLNGSRMADWVLDGPVRRSLCRIQYLCQRRDFQFITDLRHDHGAPLATPLRPPAGMKMISLVGFPLRRHLTTSFSRFCHHTLAAHGPNDGTTSLADLINWPGDIYPVWGADHYFRPEMLGRELIAATLSMIAETL